LAESFNVKTGKWLLAIPWRFDVDKIWQKIVESFLRKEAPDGVRYIRVYARDESIDNPYRSLKKNKGVYNSLKVKNLLDIKIRSLTAVCIVSGQRVKIKV
jgi:hypothetical protein